MTRTWQLQEAKNKLSQVVDEAIHTGPQVITRRGIEVAVVLSYIEYKGMVMSSQTLSDFFRNSPLVGVEIDLSRDTSPMRDQIQL